MSLINSIHKFIFNEYTPVEKIKKKSNAYFIDNSMKLNKLAFAYFLDRYQVANRMDELEIETLKKYEWFAGSLTAEQFAVSLQEFLQSSESSAISPHIRQKIETYIFDLQKSADQGYLIDLIRSSDFRLIFLILTGTYLGGKIRPDSGEIGKVTQETLRQLKGMSPGDKRIFLLGDLLHETRMTVEKKEIGWEICYFDSNSLDYKIYESPEPSPLLDPAFWDKLYAIKFQKALKLNGRIDLEDQLNKALIKKDKDIYIMKRQSKNTCHFKSLLGIIKKECLSESPVSPEETLTQWKNFKLAYGEFLLKHPEISSSIKTPAYRQQAHRKEKNDQRDRFLDIIQKGQIDQTLKAYADALDLLKRPSMQMPLYSPYEKLKYLDERLLDYLNSSAVHFEEIEPKLKALNNPCIDSALKNFKTKLEKERQSIETELEKEFSKARSGLYRMMEGVQSQLKIGDKEHFNNSVLNYNPLPKEKVLEWLARFEKEPQLLGHLQQRPFFVSLLLHGIYLGEIEKVKAAIDKLDSGDKEIVINAFDTMRNNRFLSPIFLPDKIIEVYKSSPSLDHPLFKMMGKLLMRKALNTSSLMEIITLAKINPQGLDRYELFSLKPSYNQIMEFYQGIKEKDIDRKWDSEEYRQMLFTLLRHIIMSGWFDLFENAPVYLQDKLIDSIYEEPIRYKNGDNFRQIELSLEQLNNLEAFLDVQNNATLATVLKDTIILNQYQHKSFDKLLENQTLSLTGKYNSLGNFSLLKITPEEHKPILDTIMKVQSGQLAFHILADLTKNICRDYKDPEMLSRCLEFITVHKPKALKGWFENYIAGAYQLDIKSRFFLLLSVLDDPELFDKTIVQEVININLHSLDEEQFKKIEGLFSRFNLTNLKLDSTELHRLSKDLIKKYPDSVIGKAAQLAAESEGK